MAVMTSPALDKVPLDSKAATSPSADAMAIDAEANANGVHDVLFDEPSPLTSTDAAPTTADKPPQDLPAVNGNHTSSDSATAPKPTTNVSSGIEPVAPFVPDSQANMDSLFGADTGASVSHAVDTPATDAKDQLATSGEDGKNGETQSPTESTQKVPETQSQAAEPMDVTQDKQDTLTKVEEPAPPALATDAAPTKPMNDLTIQTQQISSPLPAAHSPANADTEMQDAPSSGKVRPREDDDDETDPRDVKRTKTEETEPSVNGAAQQPSASAISHASQQPSEAPTGTSAVQSAVDFEQWPTTPMTNAQHRFLLERIRNTKKIKVANAFKEPVNPDLLGIPTYRDIVKHPMDLSTMESKLKEGRYGCLREFMEDLDLMINNSVLFNSTAHPVTQAGFNMRQYFLKGMSKMPRGSEDGTAQKSKKSGVAHPKVKKEPKPAAPVAKPPAAPAPTASSPQNAWPLNADGLPLIRRDSSTITDRPKREIHRPPPKDLPYNTAKPKKKKYQLELKFCESVLSEIMKPKHQGFAFPFLMPVDPVALNIPSYLKIIKKPMDFGTIEKNLKAGQYQKAQDFYNDAQLVFKNCFTFNPEGDEVNRMGKQLQQLFDKLWSEKSAWLATHGPASDPQSPESGESDEDEEDEVEEEVDPALDAIQRQIQELNETARKLQQQLAGKRASPGHAATKKKSSKSSAPKKKHSLTVPPPPARPKSKPKKPQAPLTFPQKQEISDGISTLGDEDMRRAVQIIKNGCPKLKDVNDDEMEIDMDELNDDTLRELLKLIKQVRGPKGGIADDDFEPPRPSHKPVNKKPKKNKPMGKEEQEDRIGLIEAKLNAFNNGGGGGGSAYLSPPARDDESSDDESSGSESEEE